MATLIDKWRLAQDIARDRTVGHVARNVALVLLGYKNAETGQCNPSIDRLSEDIGVHRRTIINALNELEGAGWIVRKRTRGTTNYLFSLDRADVHHRSPPSEDVQRDAPQM